MLARLFGRHPESSRTIAVLHFVDGLTLDEVAIDGRGAVTMHLPPNGDESVSLAQGGVTTMLDRAYELDGGPKVGSTSSLPPGRSGSPRSLPRRARHAPPDALPLPPGLEQVTFAIRKEARK